MKCFKKVAALLFCVALALSVMAVGAFADDEAVLFAGENGVRTVVNGNYQVKLSRTARDTNFNTNIYDRDDVTGVEIDAGQDVTFDITLFYTGTGTSPAIDAFQFDYDPNDNDHATIATTSEGNNAVTTAVIIPSNSATPVPMLVSGTTYGYSSGGSDDNDIQVPEANSANGRLIGRITVSFDSATQNVQIYPKIKNLKITLRTNNEDMQQPVAWHDTTSGSTVTSEANSVNGGSSVTGSTGIYANDSETTPSASGCVIVATEPVIVNPVYEVTLKSFAADNDTGIIALNTASGADTTLYYDFTNGSFVSPATADDTVVANYKYTKGSKDYATVLENTSIDGYTLQGWMVTTVSIDSTKTADASQITWAAYSTLTLTNQWNGQTSYPATTVRDSYVVGSNPTWDSDTWSGTSSTLKVTTKAENSGVNFIPKATDLTASEKTYTKFPAAQVGNITLTPVYTRNVYVATFNSGDKGATFTNPHVSAPNDTTAPARVTENDDNTNYQYTKTYTIEDLYSATAKAGETQANPYKGYEDFLLLDDTDITIANAAKGPQGLTKTAYRFVGWTVSNTDAATVTDDYEWVLKTGGNAVNGTDILVTGSAKHYGDVVFTAQWLPDIYFAKIDYQYAGDGNALILVGVPADESTRNNYNANYTYKCKDVPMFIVPAFLDNNGAAADSGTACAQRSAYVTEALTGADLLGKNSNVTAGSPEKDYFTTFDSDIFTSNNYVIFAYISAIKTDTQTTNDTDITDITIEETSTTNNLKLAYDGDVDNSNIVNVGDFGNVDTLLNNTGASNVFAVTGDNGRWGVRARLRADVFSDATNDDNGLQVFGSIKDVVGIYNKLGYVPNSGT